MPTGGVFCNCLLPLAPWFARTPVGYGGGTSPAGKRLSSVHNQALRGQENLLSVGPDTQSPVVVRRQPGDRDTLIRNMLALSRSRLGKQKAVREKEQARVTYLCCRALAAILAHLRTHPPSPLFSLSHHPHFFFKCGC